VILRSLSVHKTLLYSLLLESGFVKIERFLCGEQVALSRVSATTLTVSHAPLEDDHKKKEENLSMKKSVSRGATEEGARVATLPENLATRVKPDRKLPPRTPRWVKVLGIIALVLFLLFVILRLTGMIDHGSGGPMHMSTPIHMATTAHGGQER